jgi:hypothetical protein
MIQRDDKVKSAAFAQLALSPYLTAMALGDGFDDR